MQQLNPPGWNRPRGYSNGIAAEGRFVFVAGMVGWTGDEKFESNDFVISSGWRLKTLSLCWLKVVPGPNISAV